jgi:hypothetical protein
MDIISIAFFVGFIGDLILQLIVKNTKYDWGLREYFKLHGSIEAMVIAGGMLTLFFILMVYSKVPITYTNLAIYGVILDLLFRKLNIFPSLSGYYQSLNYFESGVWGAIPMMLPLFFNDKFK